ncbi:YvrJ family protein [Ectobacillus sp. JY-23]|uniref:YvrJ family protein n=1 Tax=Ectobacillus sp. JY-23 TaxID=2933872 RepID=UPI001FF28A9D|nr:YvrJ family protein [Ectobacillus sp. JY-23]UOY92329.1 YvrJ family protein [Ectobacillus sp. JY-23]
MDPMSIETWIVALGNFGFPIVLTIYLLVRFEKKIEFLTEAINSLKDAVRK